MLILHLTFIKKAFLFFNNYTFKNNFTNFLLVCGRLKVKKYVYIDKDCNTNENNIEGKIYQVSCKNGELIGYPLNSFKVQCTRGIRIYEYFRYLAYAIRCVIPSTLDSNNIDVSSSSSPLANTNTGF